MHNTNEQNMGTKKFFNDNGQVRLHNRSKKQWEIKLAAYQVIYISYKKNDLALLGIDGCESWHN